MAHFARDADLDWLVQGVSAKYGFERGHGVAKGNIRFG